MRKRLILILTLAVAFALASASAAFAADEVVKLDKKTFPDDAFRIYVTDNFDKDDNGELNAQEIEKATGLLGFEEEQAKKISSAKTWCVVATVLGVVSLIVTILSRVYGADIASRLIG